MLRNYFLLLFILFLTASNIALAQNRSGTYQWKYKDTAIGVLEITKIKDDKNKAINFKLRIEQSDYPCVGEISGKAKWVSLNLFEYNSNRPSRDSETKELNYCRLTFVFSGNSLIVRESDCGDFHGARCNFEGKFTRVKNSKKAK